MLTTFLVSLGVFIAGFLFGAWAGGSETRSTLLLQFSYVRQEITALLVKAIDDLQGARNTTALPWRVVDVIARLEIALGVLRDLPRAPASEVPIPKPAGIHPFTFGEPDNDAPNEKR